MSSAGNGEWSDRIAYDPGKNPLFRAGSVVPDDPDATASGTSSTRAEGTEGDDYIYVEWDSNDYLFDNNIHGLGGNDRIQSGAGNDHLYGGEGNDSLDG